MKPWLFTVLLAGFSACGSPTIPPEPSPQSTKVPVAPDAAEKRLESKGLVVWPVSRRVEATGVICSSKGFVEFFAVTPYGREYESVVALDAPPRDLHFALVGMGLQDRASAQLEGKNISGDILDCHVTWEQPDRYAQITPDPVNKDLKPPLLYACTVTDPGTEDEWWDVSPWKIHFNASKSEGQIQFHEDMEELLDPADPKYYWRNHVRQETVSTADTVIYYFHQPDPKIKGVFKPYGRLTGIREVPRHHQCEARELVIDLESQQPPKNLQWVFAGSRIDSERDEEKGVEIPFYVADRTGVIMQLMHDDFAVLDSTVTFAKKDNEIGTAFGVNKAICPPVGTRVTLVFTVSEPSPSKKKPD
ncbi:MAG: YdjY domain-containing protein [Planctomycetota bacterium]